MLFAFELEVQAARTWFTPALSVKVFPAVDSCLIAIGWHLEDVLIVYLLKNELDASNIWATARTSCDQWTSTSFPLWSQQPWPFWKSTKSQAQTKTSVVARLHSVHFYNTSHSFLNFTPERFVLLLLFKRCNYFPKFFHSFALFVSLDGNHRIFLQLFFAGIVRCSCNIPPSRCHMLFSLLAFTSEG